MHVRSPPSGHTASSLVAPAAYELPGAGPGVDEDLLQPVSSKRFLDLLINLARFKPRVARELPALSVPMPAEQVHTLPPSLDCQKRYPMQPADAWEATSGD